MRRPRKEVVSSVYGTAVVGDFTVLLANHSWLLAKKGQGRIIYYPGMWRRDYCPLIPKHFQLFFLLSRNLHIFILPKCHQKGVKRKTASVYQILHLRQLQKGPSWKNVSDQRALGLHFKAATEKRSMLDRADYRIQENETKWTHVFNRRILRLVHNCTGKCWWSWALE